MEDNQSPPEVFKTIGAPGTGKTTRVVGNPDVPEAGPSLVQQNINEGYPLKDIFICTYTNAGVDEAEERLYAITDQPKTVIQDRVSTIHSQCFGTMGMSRDQVVGWWDKKKFCDAHDLKFQGGDSEDDIMSADKPSGNSFFDIYGWLKSNRKDIEQYEDCPQPWQGAHGFPWLGNKWEEYKHDRNLMDFSDMIEGVVEQAAMQLENLGWGVLFPDEDTTTKEMFLAARDDPNRDPSVIRGKGAFIDSRILFVDEVQDLTPLQWEWYLAQKLAMEKVYIGGDDDQCLPPNAPVEVKNNPMFNPSDGEKEFQKPIKDVQVGDLVRTLTSDGEYSYRRVSNVKKKEVNEKTFRIIRTKSGNLTAVTDNHKMVARIPEADYESVVDKHYVYLMRDNEGRWRIGETDNLRQRLNVERGARCILPVASFDTKEGALEKETEWSLNYSIPQLTIKQREGEVLSDPGIRERLYDSVNPQYGMIERDLGVFLDSPPLYKKSTTRGQTQSVNINIKKCADMRGDKPRHSFNVQTSDEDVKEVLREFDELTEGDSPSSTRFRTTSTDYTELGDLAKEVSVKTGGDIITTMSPTQERSSATVTPAGNLVEGMLVPVARDGEVVWEEIVEINDRTETTEVYDLTVPGTHTFTTSGVGVSNTIYGWAGSDPEYMLDEEGDFEVLDKTYRIPEKIWNVCDGVIRQVDKRQEKDVEPHGEGGEVHLYRSPMALEIMNHIKENEGDVFILFRARYMIDNFTEDLHKAGVPYTNMSTFETWDDDIVTLRDALAKIEEYKRTKDDSIKLSGDEVQIMTECAESHMVNGDNSIDKKSQAMANWGGLKVEEIKDIFTSAAKVNGELDYRVYMSAIDEKDNLNYYEKQAIRGSIKQGTTDMYPNKVRIGTIHSSKGREAETVILALDTTDTIIDNMVGDTSGNPEKYISDAERRVYYVGMTRASERLVLAENITGDGVSLSLSNLLQEDHGVELADEGSKVTDFETASEIESEEAESTSPSRRKW